MTEETTQDQPQQETPEPGPDAIIEVRWTGAGLAFHTRRTEDTTHPAAHFADWFHRNAQCLMGLAAVEYNLRREFGEQLARVAIPNVGQRTETEKPAIVESATPRLISPHGGPLQ